MWIYYNPNPCGRNAGDCTVRAISKALKQDWGTTYAGLTAYGFIRSDMPSANHVWGAYLLHNGFRQYIISGYGEDIYTVKDFCRDNPKGVFILALDGHVVCAENGNYYDTWDSGDEIPIYYWESEVNVEDL